MIEAVSPVTKPFSNISNFRIPAPVQNSWSTGFDSLQKTKNEFSWATNPIIISALDELRKVKFDPQDVKYWIQELMVFMHNMISKKIK